MHHPTPLHSLYTLAILTGMAFFALFVTLTFASTFRSTSKSLGTGATSTLPVVFFLPHQDDEMFLAGTVRSYIDSGRRVYVIMVTDGGASRVRDAINGRDSKGKPVYCSLDHRYHDPAREGYRPLTRRAFSAARNEEFFLSMLNLGVPASHVIFANPGGLNGSTDPLYRDGELTSQLADRLIDTYFRIFGQGTYITVAAQIGEMNKYHTDHRTIRDALLRYNRIRDKWFFSEKPHIGTPIILTPAARLAKQQALAVYYLWDPTHGYFAIAAHSVLKLLNQWKQEQAEYRLSAKDLLNNT